MTASRDPVRDLCGPGQRHCRRPHRQDVFELPFVFAETMLLLLSSITFGFGMLAMNKNKVAAVNTWLFVTFLLGAGFIAMEIYEFHHLIVNDAGPDRSGFLSAFFTWWGPTVST